MNQLAQNEYLNDLREVYVKASKKDKGEILDEYCRNTGQNRKYIIHKIWHPGTPKRRKRKASYDGLVIQALIKIWEIFDYPCSQRLAPLLKIEVDRLMSFGELEISEETAKKLKRISPKTIDRKLKPTKESLHLKRKYHKKNHPWLYHQIPVRGNDWDRSRLGQEQIDLVEHCGSSAAGEFVYTLCVTDVSSGWWEGQAVMGRGQAGVLQALDKARNRTPFNWKEIHPDNDTAFINYALVEYAANREIKLSRSRPYKKNDNCFVEQKNSTHVRQIIGYLRHDTPKELQAINDLYENELRLFKNFFQPVMKLKKKTRKAGHIKRKYDEALTPYQRIVNPKRGSKKAKNKLAALYVALNPAELKRKIDQKLDRLYEIYENKKGSQSSAPYKKQAKRF